MLIAMLLVGAATLTTTTTTTTSDHVAVSDLDYLSDVYQKETRGCSPEVGVDSLKVDCSLDNSFSIAVNHWVTQLTLAYKQGSTLACDEIEQAKPPIDRYIVPAGQRSRALDLYAISDLALTSASLSCPLRMLHVARCSTLKLTRARGELRPEHLRGLQGVTKLRLLEVEWNRTTVPYEALSTLPTLQSFTLTGGALQLRQESVVLTNLKYLELSIGRLQHLPAAAFQHLPNLTMLSLFSNQIETVDVHAFEGLSQLVNISLNGNRITSLPELVFSPTPSLRRVDIYANPLTDLTENIFTGLFHLTEIINLNNRCNLTIHNRTFANLPSLRYLQLNGSLIHSLPEDAFVNSTNIQALSVNKNKLETLPENIFAGINLIKLSLEHNELVSLPRYLFANQSHLTTLELQRNRLRVLELGFFRDMRSLEYLNLKSNLIERLDDYTFGGLGRLKTLNLSGNRIKVIMMDVFVDTPNLERLSLAHNNLTISKDMNTVALSGYDNGTVEIYSPLMNLKSLQELDFSNNNVSIICSDWREFYYLEYFDLSGNSITALTDTYFPSNVTVDLSRNKIQYALDSYTGNTSTPTLILNHNPFLCDCGLYSFIHHLATSGSNRTSFRMDEATCAEPPLLRQTKLTSLRPQQLTCNDPCPSACSSCLLRPSEERRELTCTELPHAWRELPGDYKTTSLKLLKLDNRLLNLPSTVKYLDLSNLNLTDAPILVNNTALTINLTGNLLKSPPTSLLKHNTTMYLALNPLECSCAQQADIADMFLSSALIKDFNITKCADRRLISSLVPSSLCNERDIIVVASLALAILATLILALISYYRNKTLARILVKKLCCLLTKGDPSEQKYDAFISFVIEDEMYVRQKLVPNLEGGADPLRLCLHYRDWLVGGMISTQIEASVEESAKTVVVLSRRYMESKWCKMEFLLAHSKDRIVILMLDDISKDEIPLAELRAYVTLNTFVRASDPLVWDRLRDAVTRTRTHAPARSKGGGALDARLDANGMLVNGATAAPSVA